ncbi:MAG: ABC transporter ATP-binding protein [Sedimentibacter sp.]
MKDTIQVNNASFSYGDKQIFSGINLSVKQGELFCILGPNGCGKTTLLDCILGLLKLNNGNIIIDGSLLNSIKSNKIAEKMAYVPQVHQKSFPYTVKEIVLMGRAYKTTFISSPTNEDKDIAIEAMKKVGINHLADLPYTQISGGECQLVMIARALAQKPKIIIMDEPTAHLDFKNEIVLLETVVDLIRENNISVIMATHFPNHAYYFENNNIPTTLGLMNNGIFEQVGSPSEVLNEKNIQKTYQINSKIMNYKVDENTSVRQIIPLSIVKI